MVPIRLYPVLDDVLLVNGLESMLSQIEQYVTPRVASNTQMNVALLWLGVLTAMQHAGVLIADNVPELSFRYGDNFYVVDTTSLNDGSGQESVNLGSVVPTNIPKSRPGNSGVPDCLVKGNPLHNFLTKLLQHGGSPIAAETQATWLTSRLSRPLASHCNTGSHLRGTYGPMTELRSTPICALRDKLELIDAIGREQTNLPCRLNVAYWSLGANFRALSLSLLQSGQSKKTKSLAAKVAVVATELGLTTTNQVMALRKRIDRAEKFVVLVEQLGEGVLAAVPLVCVTNIDRMSVAACRALQAGDGQGLQDSVAAQLQLHLGNSTFLIYAM